METNLQILYENVFDELESNTFLIRVSKQEEQEVGWEEQQEILTEPTNENDNENYKW